MNSKSPFGPLLLKLSGQLKPPARALQGWQQYMKVAYQDTIKPEVERQWAEKGETGGHTASCRAGVAMKMFEALPAEEKAALKKQAVDEKNAAVKAYEENLKKPVSKAPVDRQK